MSSFSKSGAGGGSVCRPGQRCLLCGPLKDQRLLFRGGHTTPFYTRNSAPTGRTFPHSTILPPCTGNRGELTNRTFPNLSDVWTNADRVSCIFHLLCLHHSKQHLPSVHQYLLDLINEWLSCDGVASLF